MDALYLKTNELIRKSFELWDIKDWNIEEIDPIVRLLFAACANESIQLDKNIKESALLTRESLLNAFLPYLISGPKPASAMVQAVPVEPQIKLNDKFTFEYFKPKLQGNKSENTVLSFIPAIDITLFKANIRFAYYCDQLVTFPDHQTLSTNLHPESQHSIWLGIKVDESIRSLNGFPLFFNIKRPQLKANDLSDYDFLDKIRVFYESREIGLSKALTTGQYYQFRNTEAYQFSYDLASYTDLVFNVMNYFSPFYFFIDDPAEQKGRLHRKKHPDFFTEVFEPDTLKLFKEELIWLEFKFDAVLPDLLKSIDIHINAFPVINQKIVTLDLDKEEPVKKIPLTGDEELIGVTSYKVFDEYRLLVKTTQATQTPFIIRDMDMEKYAQKDLVELMEDLVERFISDNQAFQEEYRISVDDMNRLREAIKPIVAAKMKRKNIPGSRNIYAIYNPGTRKDISSVELMCGVTNGATANGIFQGERLKSSNSSLDPNQIMFLTKTLNGKNALSSDEKAGAVKRLMLSGNKIITTGDIIEFCYQETGNEIQNITVGNGAHMHEKELRRCINVNITLKKDAIKDDDLLYLKKNLENKISLNSGLLLPVVVNLITN
jgi:hypothetical protein